MKTIFKTIGIIIGVIMLISVLMALFSKDEKKELVVDSKVEKTRNDLAKLAPSESLPSDWSYSEDVDEMSNKKTYFATTTSTNTVDFQFPYSGGSTFTLTVRNGSIGNEVIIEVSKGQFMDDYNNQRGVRLKFDDGEPVTYHYSQASDGRATIIFLQKSNSIIAKLKKAKHLKVDAEFYSEGRKVMNFDISDLNWEK